MEYRTFGRTGLSVSVLGFGGSELGWDGVPQTVVERLLRQALDAGLNTIDTAACYHDSEEKIGIALLGRPRDSYHLFTKCGHASGLPHDDWSPELVGPSVERSLKRLKTDHVDLVQLHSCSADVLRRGDLLDALLKVKDEGKTRFIGYSGDGQDAVYAIETGLFDTLQTSISVADQEAIDLTIPLARERGMGVIAKRPVANVAWRIGKPPEDGHTDAVLDRQGYADEYARRLDLLGYDFLDRPLQEAVGRALRFTVSVDGVHTAIVGTTKPGRVEQNAQLLEAGPLPAGELEAIRARWHAVATSDWVGKE
jgi:aryl-alcohol dehydrogenase-like predicted oxidoreductase